MAPATGVGSGQVKLTWTAPPTRRARSPTTSSNSRRTEPPAGRWSTTGCRRRRRPPSAGSRTAPPTGSGSRPRRTWSGPATRFGAGHAGVDSRRPDLLDRDRVAGGRCGPVRRAARRGRNALPNGSAVTDYLIEWSVDGATWTRVDDGVSTATTYTVTGLAGGTNYSSGWPPVNAIGTGAWSVKQARHRPPAPAAPNGLTAAVAPAAGVGSGEVQAVLDRPGEQRVGDHRLRRSSRPSTARRGRRSMTAVSTATGHTADRPDRRHRLPVPGRRHERDRHRAVERDGDGDAGRRRRPPQRVDGSGRAGGRCGFRPGAAVLDRPGGATGRRSPTTSSNGQSTAVTWTRVDDGVSTATTSTVGGLTNGTQYRFRVAAANAVGTGSWSATVTATPVGSPAAPGGLTAAVAPATGVGSGRGEADLDRPGEQRVGGHRLRDRAVARRHDVDARSTTACRRRPASPSAG